ncbi:hypothetical protein ACFFGQ_05020, partial [Rufibacter quisquiliarum]
KNRELLQKWTGKSLDYLSKRKLTPPDFIGKSCKRGIDAAFEQEKSLVMRLPPIRMHFGLIS